MKVYVRPSQILGHDECPFAAFLQYVRRVKSASTSANLVFGTAVHWAISNFIKALVAGMKFDLVQAFLFKWQEQVDSLTVQYNSTFSPEDLMEVGKKHCELFPAVWDAAGLEPLVDKDGPLVERRLQVEILPGVILSAEPDFVGINQDSEIVVVDFKTPATASTEDFALMSDQLTSYQIVVEAHGRALGVDRVAKVGFMELLKKKVPKTNRGSGPEVLPPLLVEARSQAEIAAYQQKVGWIAEDMRLGRYPKRPRMAFNSPCAMCDYAQYCIRGEKEGLIFPQEEAA
ncbi:MAG: PD-(D/E)XK nuclease family protein [Desulfobulbaceae bacterium]